MSVMPDYLLTFELSKDKDQLFIHTDENGMDFLMGELTRLSKWVKNRETDHIHLMIKEWGGSELTSDSQGDEILNYVKTYCWKTNK